MTSITEGALTFTFAASANASKYDDWSFYRNQFQNACYRDNKAVDLMCRERDQAWVIEVKDYRQNRRTKAVELADEIAIKVRDSLAGLVAAQTKANDQNESCFARGMLQTATIRVVCHIEQPAKSSKLRPRAIELDKLQDQLRRLLKAIDPHPMVMDCSSVPAHLPWTVA